MYPKKSKNKIIRLIIICIAIALLSLGLIAYQWIKAGTHEAYDFDMSYKGFLTCLQEGEVDTVYYSAGDQYITFTRYGDKSIYKTDYPDYEDFKKDVLESGAKVETANPKEKVSYIYIFIELGMSLGFIILIVYTMTGGTLSGRSFSVSVAQKSNVRFSDVIGQDEILDDIRFITELIKHPERGKDIGVSMPKGILFSGSPGCGKTLIAKAIAGEADVPFIYLNGSSLVEMFVGLGAKRIRSVFKKARAAAPCVLFIDEIDAIGEKRRSGSSGVNEMTQTLNALLQEMDGFNGREGIFVLAATNRPESLDEALTRAGRFDRQIVVGAPKDTKTRVALFDKYLEGKKVSKDIDITALAKQCQGFTGADISAICNEAGMIAIIKDKDAIDSDCMEEAIDRKIFKGDRQKKEERTKQQERDREIVAFHEAGHAVMTYLAGMPIARVSIIGTTSGVGGAVFKGEKDTCFTTKKAMLDEIKVAYAGRAAEEIRYGDVTGGAAADISQATELLKQYIERYGFDEDSGLLDMAMLQENNFIHGTEIVGRMRQLSKSLYTDTKGTLSENFEKVIILAGKLLDKETLTGEEAEEIIAA